jgi:hypothetical protein
MEVVPPKGAIIKAQIYATTNQIYQVAVHVPQIRLTSADVQKFFEPFNLWAEPLLSPQNDWASSPQFTFGISASSTGSISKNCCETFRR